MNNLPPAVIGYLEQASLTIAQQQNFSPASEEDFTSWLETNLAEIVLKAKELQFNCWLKLVSNKETHNLVSETIKEHVWNSHNSTVLKTLHNYLGGQ